MMQSGASWLEVRGNQGTSSSFGREIDRGFSRGDVSLERARAVLGPATGFAGEPVYLGDAQDRLRQRGAAGGDGEWVKQCHSGNKCRRCEPRNQSWSRWTE